VVVVDSAVDEVVDVEVDEVDSVVTEEVDVVVDEEVDEVDSLTEEVVVEVVDEVEVLPGGKSFDVHIQCIPLISCYANMQWRQDRWYRPVCWIQGYLRLNVVATRGCKSNIPRLSFLDHPIYSKAPNSVTYPFSISFLWPQ